MKNGEKISIFLPCRKGSERILQKNIKPFAGYEFGLIQIKLEQLFKVHQIDEIILSTNDEIILEFANRYKEKRLRIYTRTDELSSSSTSTDQLIEHVSELITEGHILWTHVTSPFISAELYEKLIVSYFNKLEMGFDSLMTTSLVQSFLWKNDQPLNYDRTLEKWPRTQTLEHIHHINSGAFITSVEIYKTKKDRIGKKPYLYLLDKLTSYDIDWHDDFVIAECMVKQGIVQL